MTSDSLALRGASMLCARPMRAALYYAPPADHPLTHRAAHWLGRDAWSRADLARGACDGFDPGTLDALTAEPRRYGFHATLKPPFRLAEGCSLDRLRSSLASFGRGRPPVLIPALRLERIGAFFALTPGGSDPADLKVLAADAVRDFDTFRASPTEADIARRRPERLTPRQRENLAAWGYPYVFDEFRFHMTLTGPVPEEQREAMDALLRARFADFIGRPLMVDTLCLFLEPVSPGDFVVDTAIPMAGPRG
jgi:putative phosphonate metabolism protein